ncbi:hypothetical protein BV881_34100 [Streptomyces sp. ZL-24]|nr:hypothetical protein BV881_34100 [Streptomyces sp. ZL-24]
MVERGPLDGGRHPYGAWHSLGRRHTGVGAGEDGDFAEQDSGLGYGPALGAVVLRAVPGGGRLDGFD